MKKYVFVVARCLLVNNIAIAVSKGENESAIYLLVSFGVYNLYNLVCQLLFQGTVYLPFATVTNMTQLCGR